MSTFFDSLHCASKTHCRTCRNKDGGRAWRESLMKTFEDIKEVDFICPHGLEWDAPKQIVIQPKKKVVYKADGSVEIDGVPCVSCAEKRKQRLAELNNPASSKDYAGTREELNNPASSKDYAGTREE